MIIVLLYGQELSRKNDPTVEAYLSGEIQTWTDPWILEEPWSNLTSCFSSCSWTHTALLSSPRPHCPETCSKTEQVWSQSPSGPVKQEKPNEHISSYSGSNFDIRAKLKTKTYHWKFLIRDVHYRMFILSVQPALNMVKPWAKHH